MRSIIKYIVFGVFIILHGCDSKRAFTPAAKTEKPNSAINPVPDTSLVKKPILNIDTAETDFNKEFADFILAIQNEDSVAFQKYMPATGLYIIEVPGAMPKFTLVKQISSFRRSYPKKSFFSIKTDLSICKLENGLPEFSCDPAKYNTKSGYSKEGCFTGKPDKFIKSRMWHYASLDNAATQNIEVILPRLSQTIQHTNSHFKFHFGLENGQWKVFFIELSVPCSA